jgi:A/G-specific adenine glycosylase
MASDNPPAEPPEESQPRATLIAEPLLRWYAREGRTLPWRDIGDPYRILVSEIMLQQTRVSTVLRYYPAFLERFPTIADLAAASEEEVLAQWSGLGFYRRARNLHACAREVVSQYGGEVPGDPDLLGALPGIGRYTVGAILSSAHNARLPILDGNVVRVLSRLFCVAGDPATAKVNRRLWQLATAVLPEDRPGDFNQSLMDLGATVCKPTAPACGTCPLKGLCSARGRGVAEEYPHAGRRTRVTFVERVALFAQRPDGSFLLVRRPRGGLLANMWELPTREKPEDQQSALVAAELASDLGIDSVATRVATSEHRFSHRHWTTEIYRIDALDGAPPVLGTGDLPGELRWSCAEELVDLAWPEASRKTVAACLQRAEPGSRSPAPFKGAVESPPGR